MADLQVAVLVVETDKRTKVVQLEFGDKDGSYGNRMVLEPDAAVRLGHALIQSGKHAQSSIVVAASVPPMGTA